MQSAGNDDAGVLCERHCGFDGFQARGNDLRTVCVVGMEERLEAGLVSAPGLKRRRPTGQEVAEQNGVVLVEPVQGLRIVLLEGMGEAVGEADLVVDQFASALGQADQRTHADALRPERCKSLWVAYQKVQSQFGIRGIVLGTAGLEGLAILGKSQWVDRKEHQKVVLLQCIDYRSFG